MYCNFSCTYHQSCFPPSSFSQFLRPEPERHSSIPSSPSPIDTTSRIYLNWSISLSFQSPPQSKLLGSLAYNKYTEIFPHTLLILNPMNQSTFHTAAQVIFERCISAVTPCKLLASLTWLRTSHALLLSVLAILAFRVLRRSTLRALHMQCMCLACLFPYSLPPSSVDLPFSFRPQVNCCILKEVFLTHQTTPSLPLALLPDQEAIAAWR